MKKDNKKKKSMCTIGRTSSRQLLARLIIGQTERNVRHGVNRTERINGSEAGRKSFLNTALAPIATENVLSWNSYGSNGINVITQEKLRVPA